MIIGLIGGSLFLLAGFLTLLPWPVSGSIGGVLLGGWFGGEIKKRLDRLNEKGKETRVIRFRKKSLLEDNVSEMRTAGWEPKWESYPRDPDRPSSPPDSILGRNGEDTAKTRTQWAQTALEIPIPKQVTLLERCGYGEARDEDRRSFSLSPSRLEP